jgi:hypothetical protein
MHNGGGGVYGVRKIIGGGDEVCLGSFANGLFTFSHTGVVELLTKRRLS